MFEAFGAKLRYHVEIKDEIEATPARVLETVSAAGLEDRVMLTSFSPRPARARAADRAADVRSAGCSRARIPSEIDAAAGAGFAMVGVRASELDEALVRQAHARGLEIRAFGVETDADMQRAAAHAAATA